MTLQRRRQFEKEKLNFWKTLACLWLCEYFKRFHYFLIVKYIGLACYFIFFCKCTLLHSARYLCKDGVTKQSSVFYFWSAKLLSILQPNLNGLSAESAFSLSVADVMRAITASHMWQTSALNPLACLMYAEYRASKANEKDIAKALGLNISI